MKKSIVNTAMITALCIGVMGVSTEASAVINTYDWNGMFTMLDSVGGAIANTSNPGGSNQFQTPISGTMQFDTVTGAGNASVALFHFWNSYSPTEIYGGINMQVIGDGMGGAGSLMIGNLQMGDLNGTPVSISFVSDASGFLGGDLSGGGQGAVPASDGTYVGPNVPDTVVGPGGYSGYLGLGPIPIATTAWNTTNGSGCSAGSCYDITPSGVLPLVLDDAFNNNDYTANEGGDGIWPDGMYTYAKGVGGSPMQDGQFAGNNFTYDFTSMTFTGAENGTIGPFDVGQVPIPAAAWLFGSGLLGLVGVARRKSRA